MATTKVSPDLLDLNAGITISVADNSDNLTLTSTDADASSGPNLNLYRNSSSPADNDEIGNIAFNGRNDNNQDVKYAEIEAYIRDTSDGTEDGLFNFNTIVGGSVSSRMKLDTSETVFNDDSKDLDFRVESDNDANAFFVWGEYGHTGLGTTTPEKKLVVSNGGAQGIELSPAESGVSRIFSYNRSSNAYTPLTIQSEYLTFGTGTSNAERVRINAGGIAFNGDSAAANSLDDYEEGTCTISVTTSGGGASVSLGSSTASYTKVGNMVNIAWYSAASTVNNVGSGIMRIDGFPFSSKNVNAHFVGAITHANTGANAFWTSSDIANSLYINPNAATAYPIKDGTTSGVSLVAGGSRYIMITATYQTN